MGTTAFELNLTTDEVTPSTPDPQNIYAQACWHVQHDDGAVRVFALVDGRIRLVGKCAISSDGTLYTAVGDLAWRRIARATGRILSMAIGVKGGLEPSAIETSDGDIATPSAFLTFDLDPTTAEVSGVSRTREHDLRERSSSTLWQVAVTPSAVMVFARTDKAMSMIGRCTRSDTGLVDQHSLHASLSQDHHWALVAKSIASASAFGEGAPVPPIAPRAVKRRRLLSKESGPRSTREIVLSTIALAMYVIVLLSLIVQWSAMKEYPLWGVHVVFVPLAAVLTPYWFARGVFLMTSKEALAERPTKDMWGNSSGDPLTSMGIGLAMLGLFGFGYPVGVINAADYVKPDVPFVIPAPPTPTIATTPAHSPDAPPVVIDAPTPTLAEYVAHATLADGADDRGAWDLARFASQNTVFADVAVTDAETTIPLVLKDSDLERGKRLCATGALTDIERKDLDGRPVFVGALRTADGDDVRFIAVGSSGSLVKRSSATLCGIVTGRAEKAVMLVGMFDLPENALRAVER